MKKGLLISSILAACFILYSTNAQAQCLLGVCGGVYVSPPPVVVAPPPPVVVAPPPPVVVAPAPVVMAPAPVVMAPAPVVVQQPVQQVTVQQPVQQLQPAHRPYTRELGLGLGLRANIAYNGGNELTLYGGGGVIRAIPSHRFGLELTIDGNGSSDGYSVPIGLSGLVFFNPRGHVQPYLVAGLDVNFIRTAGNEYSFVYTGGHAGVGLEFIVGRRIGITLDARTFVQGHVGDDPCQEEVEYGVTFNTGFNFYL